MQTKKDGIQTMLSQSITTEHTIHPSFGTSEFFEFVLRNPYNVEHTVKIEWEDKSLQYVFLKLALLLHALEFLKVLFVI